MPYGLPKEIDTPENNAKMERCVLGLTKQGKSKDSAIAMCKSSMMKSKMSEMMITNYFEFAEPEAGSKTSEIEILKTGVWNHPAYGKMKITQETLEEMIQHFEDKLRKGVYITEGHPVADEELPAVGWVKSLVQKGSDTLTAVIEWTDKGMELLKSKAYKFFSPEFYFTFEDPETRERFNNVLTGGALTNKPYFKSLEAIVLSEQFLISKSKVMELEKIIAKEPSELTAEEKTFLISMKEDLDADTIKKFSLDEGGESEEEKKSREEKEATDKAEADKRAEVEKATADAKAKEEADAKAKAEAEEKAKGGGGEEKEEEAEKQFAEKVKASEAKIAGLEKEVGELKQEKKKASVDNIVGKLVCSEENKNGVILLKSKDKVSEFAMSLNEDQMAKFEEIMKELPKANVFGEIGSGKDGEEEKGETDDVKLDKAAKKLMSEDKNLDYEKALLMAEKSLKK